MSDKIDVNSGGGSLIIGNSALGGDGNTVSGNSITVSNSLNSVPNSESKSLLSTLVSLRSELTKATDLPEDAVEDLVTSLEAAIKAMDRPEPKKERTVEKLTTMQQILDGLKANFASAVSLGTLVGQVLLAARGLTA